MSQSDRDAPVFCLDSFAKALAASLLSMQTFAEIYLLHDATFVLLVVLAIQQCLLGQVHNIHHIVRLSQNTLLNHP